MISNYGNKIKTKEDWRKRYFYRFKLTFQFTSNELLSLFLAHRFQIKSVSVKILTMAHKCSESLWFCLENIFYLSEISLWFLTRENLWFSWENVCEFWPRENLCDIVWRIFVIFDQGESMKNAHYSRTHSPFYFICKVVYF